MTTLEPSNPPDSSTDTITTTSLPTLPQPFTNTSPPPTLVTQGAESHLYRTIHLSPSTHAALKIRPSKPYRHAILDARLTKQRILQEARVLVKLRREGCHNVPGVLAMDWVLGNGRDGAAAWLLMEWVEGVTLKEALVRWERDVKEKAVSGDKLKAAEEKVRSTLRRVGVAIAKLHSRGVVHGDLTSSNIMLRPSLEQHKGINGGVAEEGIEAKELQGEVVLIDFGLAQQTVQEEERAVDLYVLERAFGSTHPKQEDMFDQEVLRNGYAKVDQTGFSGAKVVLKRLEDVRMRGRKRSMVG